MPTELTLNPIVHEYVGLNTLPVETLSPFLPGTHIQFALDSTSLDLMKRCPRLYQYQMIEGWQPKGEGIHLRFGIEYHQALHDYETFKAQDLSHDEALIATLRELCIRIKPWQPEPHKESEKKKSKANLVRAIIDYLDKWKDDPAKTVILNNDRPAMEVSFRLELDWGPDFGLKLNGLEPAISQPYLLCGHLDRIVDYQGGYFVMDRKTASSGLTDYYYNQFHPSNQMTLYNLAGKIVLESPIRGVIIDAVNVGEQPEFGRHFTYRTQDELDEWLYNLKFLLAQFEDYAAEGYWPMNDTSCDKYGGCRFREVCQKSPQARENFLKSGFTKLKEGEKWNPLKSR